MKREFWEYLQQLVDNSQTIIDRPKGSTHPRFAGKQYPIDYGYLNDTTSIDGSGVDIWVGSMGKHEVTGTLLTVDLLKQDTELKILYDCTEAEIQLVLDFVNMDQMRAIAVKRGKSKG